MKMTHLLFCPIGPLLMTEEKGAIIALRFLREGETCDTASPDTPLSRRTQRWLDRYFAGENPAVDLPLAPAGTAFQQRVWHAVCDVACGETVSYGELARRIGCRSARAVGAALGKNPVWILIPCHRVIGADGSLTGYEGGLDKKAALLALEKTT